MSGDNIKASSPLLAVLLIGAIVGMLVYLSPRGEVRQASNSPKQQAIRTEQQSAAGEKPDQVAAPDQLNASTDETKGGQQRQSWDEFFEKAKTDPIAWLTAAIVGLTFVQIWIYRGEIGDNRVIERAYVSMSQNKPGLKFGPTYSNSKDQTVQPVQDVSVNVKIKNNGNTPAIITAQLLQIAWGKGLPSVPPYQPHEVKTIRASLVKEESVTIFANFLVPVSILNEVRLGKTELFLFGYTDYMDKFGSRHRAGYARVYKFSEDAKADGEAIIAKLAHRPHDAEAHNNLSFVSFGGYNYDRRRVMGEGDDWDEKV